MPTRHPPLARLTVFANDASAWHPTRSRTGLPAVPVPTSLLPQGGLQRPVRPWRAGPLYGRPTRRRTSRRERCSETRSRPARRPCAGFGPAVTINGRLAEKIADASIVVHRSRPSLTWRALLFSNHIRVLSVHLLHGRPRFISCVPFAARDEI